MAAWNNTGFPVADEHYQIIEFAQWKLGELPAGKLAWEFGAGIRSSFQPWVAVQVFRAARGMGVTDPFALALLLRLFTAAMALAAMHSFVRATVGLLQEAVRHAFVLLSYFLWFLPLLLVRFSSEGWSAIFLLWMLAGIMRRGWLWPLRAGLWAGFAILCRPPVGLIILSALAWMKWMRRDRWSFLPNFGAGLLAVLMAGLALDALFYGSPVPSIWNYLRLGFTGGPSRFDAFPWYYYPPWILKYAVPPIGAAILLAFGILLIKQPRHPAIWCALPFLLAHTIIPHKELRFLFPLAILVPWLLVDAWTSPRREQVWGNKQRAVVNTLVGLAAVINLAALLFGVFTPADAGRERLVRTIKRQVPHGPAVINYWMDTEPPWAIRVPPFYLPPDATEEMITDPCQVSSGSSLGGQFLVAGREPPGCPGQETGTWKMVGQLEKPWEWTFRRFHEWEDAKPGWRLYEWHTVPSTLAP